MHPHAQHLTLLADNVALRREVVQLKSTIDAIKQAYAQHFESEVERRLKLQLAAALSAGTSRDGESKRAGAPFGYDGAGSAGSAESKLRPIRLITKESVKGPFRPTNEDVEVSATSSDGWTFFAVFDGHGGNGTSKMLGDPERGLAPFVFAKLSELQSSLGITPTRSGVGDRGEASAAYDKIFEVLPTLLKHWFLEYDVGVLLPAALDPRGDVKTSGSTAAVILIAPDRFHFWMCTVGDTRIILVDQNGALLHETKDQKPSDVTELARIRAAGGYIASLPGEKGITRVMGNLSTARAFGDFLPMLKPRALTGSGLSGLPLLQACETDILTAAPNVEPGFAHKDYSMLAMIACDGFWDVIGSKEAASYLTSKEVWNGGNVRSDDIGSTSMGEMLTNLALSRGSTDNVSVLVAEFGGGVPPP